MRCFLDVFKNIVTTEEEDGLLIKIILRFVLDEESVHNDLLKLPRLMKDHKSLKLLRKRLTQNTRTQFRENDGH